MKDFLSVIDNSLGKGRRKTNLSEFGAVMLSPDRAENVRQAANLPEIREPKKAMTRAPRKIETISA